MQSASYKAKLYYKVRSLVLEKATLPRKKADTGGEYNQSLVRENLRQLCKDFNPRISIDEFWFECWSHFRWAGIKAATGSADVNAHRLVGVFNDFRELSKPDWDFPEKFPEGESAWGSEATKYLSAQPPYNARGLIRKKDKPKKTVRLARALNKILQEHGPDRYLVGVFGRGVRLC
jgi:hypothetical protein